MVCMVTIIPLRDSLKRCIQILLPSMRLHTDLAGLWHLPGLYLPVLLAMEVVFCNLLLDGIIGHKKKEEKE